MTSSVLRLRPGNQVAAGRHVAQVDLAHGLGAASALFAHVDGEHRQADKAFGSQIVPVQAAQDGVAVFQQRGLVDLLTLIAGQLCTWRSLPIRAASAERWNSVGQLVFVDVKNVAFPAFKRCVGQRAGQGCQQRGRDRPFLANEAGMLGALGMETSFMLGLLGFLGRRHDRRSSRAHQGHAQVALCLVPEIGSCCTMVCCCGPLVSPPGPILAADPAQYADDGPNRDAKLRNGQAAKHSASGPPYVAVLPATIAAFSSVSFMDSLHH